MDKNNIEKLREVNYEKIAMELALLCHTGVPMDDSSIYLIAYVLLRIQLDDYIKFNTVEEFIKTSKDSERRGLFIKQRLKKIWEKVVKLKDKYDVESLKAFILYFEPDGRMAYDSTPVGVAKLAAKIMDIEPGDRVADFGTGKANFIRESMILQPDAIYYGNDVNTAAVEIATIRAQILGGEINIVQEDIFDMKDKEHKFDVAFANYPFGMRARDAWRNGFNQFEEFIKTHPDFSRTVSLDWVFNKAVYNTIAGPRRAVCIMTNGSTWNTLDRNARRYFLDRGAVEAVISLPSNLYQNTSIGTTMIIFSHGNTSTMMVDASEMCETGRRYNVITDKNIEKIISCLTCEGKYSKRVSFQEIRENDYVLNPVRYMTEEISIPDGVPFESIIKRITRGAPLTAKELDKLSSATSTNAQYLMLANIKDGIIDDELPYIKKIDAKQEKYCVKNNSLIISKNGYPYKIAVAEVPAGYQILANGNLFVIELDEDKVNPYFMKAFLESEVGISILKNITVGATIPNIGLEQLKKITVPCPPVEKQNVIANKYLAMVDEIKLLRRKTNKLTSNLKHLFDEYEEA